MNALFKRLPVYIIKEEEEEEVQAPKSSSFLS
jgi:hypothetical protein